MERYTITPEALHALLRSNQDVLVIDVRQPLDLLGDSVIIPRAQWLAPDEVRAHPSLLQKEQDLMVCCTAGATKPFASSCIVLSQRDSYGSNSSREASMAGEPMASRSNRTKNPFI
jgi:rhodanese-related sulfurtransferase